MENKTITCPVCGEEFILKENSPHLTTIFNTTYYCSTVCKRKDFFRQVNNKKTAIRRAYAMIEACEFITKENPLIRYKRPDPLLYSSFNYYQYCPKSIPATNICLNCPYPKCIREYFDIFKDELTGLNNLDE